MISDLNIKDMDFKIQIGEVVNSRAEWVYISLPDNTPVSLVEKVRTAIEGWSDEETKRSIKEQVAKGNLPDYFLIGL